jgi:tetratricopeptide (TPR) repeat protein
VDETVSGQSAAEPVADEAEEGQDEKDGAAAAAASSSSGVTADPRPGSSSQTSDEPVAGTSKESEPKEEEASDCDVAFEVLSLARDVFSRNQEKDNECKLKLAEALQTLAEISLEWENFTTASELFQESLSLRKEALPAEDRLIAESYYHIGITFSFLNEIERANDCFRSAIHVIESKIAALKSSPSEENEREIAELESLLPEMAAKIEDSKEQMQNAAQVAKVVADEESRESEVAAKVHLSPTKVVNNITHLVKRKRPASPPSTNGVSTPEKKTCPTNGDGDHKSEV